MNVNDHIPYPDALDFEYANRLARVMFQVGNTIWELQQLEDSLVMFFVIRVKASRGMGEESGNKLLAKFRKQTLGTTVKDLNKAGVIDDVFSDSLRKILTERNWLVHNSRREYPAVIYNEKNMNELLQRICKISDLSMRILKEIETECMDFVRSCGINEEMINKVTVDLLRERNIPI